MDIGILAPFGSRLRFCKTAWAATAFQNVPGLATERALLVVSQLRIALLVKMLRLLLNCCIAYAIVAAAGALERPRAFDKEQMHSHVAIMLHAMESLLQSQTITHAMLLRFLRSGHATLLWCPCMLCIAMLQSRLMRAPGHWQHHTASMMQPRNHTLLSRTNTTAAELYYLRHMRSCAAAPMGNKGGSPSPSTALQISGADVIGRLLQSIWRHCYMTVFLPVGRLLQSIGQMVRYYAKTAMKLITVSFALLQDLLTWFTPLESAACFHLANAYMHQNFHTH